MSRLKSYLEKTYKDLRYQKLLQMKCTPENNLPVQNNGYDCGVFVCLFGERISRSATFDFQEADCSYFRLRIASEIQQGRLVVDKCCLCSSILVPFDEAAVGDFRIGYPCTMCQAWFHSKCVDEEESNQDFEKGFVCGMCSMLFFNV